MRRVVALVLLGFLSGCAPSSRDGDGAPPSAPLLAVPPLAEGMRLTIAPNLPDVTQDDVPETTQRLAEVLAAAPGRLRLRWTGRIRRESAESADRRTTWLRARTIAGSRQVPTPPAPPLFEETEVTGTLDFPDFGTADAVLLPGLWPEGKALLRDSSCLWLAGGTLSRLTGERRAHVAFAKGRALKDPVAALLERASEVVRERDPDAWEVWKLMPERGRSPLTVNGVAGEVSTLRLASWFGVFEVLPDPQNPIILAVDPSPTSASGVLSMFAPARVLRMLLAYRVVALDTRPAAATASGSAVAAP